MIRRPGDDDGNIHRALIGQRGRAGGNGEGNAFSRVVYADRGESRRLRDRTDGKRREGPIPLRNPDTGDNGCRGGDFTCAVRREDVFADGLGDGVGIRLRGDGRLSPGENLFGHILF